MRSSAGGAESVRRSGGCARARAELQWVGGVVGPRRGAAVRRGERGEERRAARVDVRACGRGSALRGAAVRRADGGGAAAADEQRRGQWASCEAVRSRDEAERHAGEEAAGGDRGGEEWKRAGKGGDHRAKRKGRADRAVRAVVVPEVSEEGRSVACLWQKRFSVGAGGEPEGEAKW